MKYFSQISTLLPLLRTICTHFKILISNWQLAKQVNACSSKMGEIWQLANFLFIAKTDS